MEKMDTAIGKSIRNYRWLQGVPLADLAAAIGISDQQLRSHESGKSCISAARLMEISRHLGVDVAAFFQRNMDAAAPQTIATTRAPSDALQSGKYLAALITNFQRLDDVQKQAIMQLVSSMAKGEGQNPTSPPPQRLPLIKLNRGAPSRQSTLVSAGD
jgi:transcriptional regulator with XRE-family HTH domain